MRFQAYLFDLDGTVYLGEQLFPGVSQTLMAIRARHGKVLFLSNNPLRRRNAYLQKLLQMGVQATEEEIINSAYVLCQHLKKLEPNAVVFPIGEKALRQELRSHGFQISHDPQQIQYVIASFDRTFSYRKLEVALRAMEHGAHFIATNPDRTCPFEEGELPDAGAVIGAIEGMTGKKVEWVAGKPSAIMTRAICEHLALSPEEILMVGDRLETDIAMGQWGFKTALVLSGVTRYEDLAASPWQPDYILEGIWQLPEQID